MRFVAVTFAILVLLGLIAREADASEPPPVIRDVQRVMREVRTTLEVPRVSTHAQPADGPMCAALIEEQEGATQLGVLLEEPANEHERAVVARQIRECRRDVGRSADPFMVLALYRWEEHLGVPDEHRGILGAVWCVEAAMRLASPRDHGPIRGDYANGVARARGPFQGHGWLWEWCGLSVAGADDLFVSAACYWSRVVDRYQRTGSCSHRWRVAEALTANGPRYLPAGCAARSGHWRELERWQ